MKRNDLTIGQANVYAFLVAFISDHLYAPSIREICTGCGYTSPSTVYSHLWNLQHKGLIELPDEVGKTRSIKLVGYKLVKEDRADGEK